LAISSEKSQAIGQSLAIPVSHGDDAAARFMGHLSQNSGSEMAQKHFDIIR
jgi:hypothetical protein